MHPASYMLAFPANQVLDLGFPFRPLPVASCPCLLSRWMPQDVSQRDLPRLASQRMAKPHEPSQARTWRQDCRFTSHALEEGKLTQCDAQYRCFESSCTRSFGSPKTRRLHLVDYHQYPRQVSLSDLVTWNPTQLTSG